MNKNNNNNNENGGITLFGLNSLILAARDVEVFEDTATMPDRSAFFPTPYTCRYKRIKNIRHDLSEQVVIEKHQASNEPCEDDDSVCYDLSSESSLEDGDDAMDVVETDDDNNHSPVASTNDNLVDDCLNSICMYSNNK